MPKRLTPEQLALVHQKLAKSALGRTGWLSPRDEETLQHVSEWHVTAMGIGQRVSYVGIRTPGQLRQVLDERCRELKKNQVLVYAVATINGLERSAMIPRSRVDEWLKQRA